MPPAGDVQLSIGYWVVSHKDTLRKWWAISLIAFIVLTFVWGLVFTAVFFSQSGQLNQQLAARLAQAGQWPATALPSPASVTASTPVAIYRDATHADLMATLNNPNANWGASALTAHFVVDGQALPAQTIFINPSASRPLIGLNITVADGAHASAQVVIDATTWSKASSATLPDANFHVDSLTLTPTIVTINGQSVSTIRLHAAVTNRSVYNYRHVVVPVILSSQHGVMAVDQITTDAWPTLTSKSIESTWSYPLGGQLTAEVSPQVSRFDNDNVYR